MFCFSGDRDLDSLVVFDMWNPDSVHADNDDVVVREMKYPTVKRCCRDTPCVICSRPDGRLYICDECLFDEELGLQQ